MAEEFEVVIYKLDAMLKTKIEAEDAKEARMIAKIMLEEGDGVYSDFDEADFVDPDREYLYVTFSKD
jgi:hypothetical protein